MIKPKWNGPPIESRGDKGNLHVMLAITTAQMRRFGASVEERVKLQENVKKCGSFEEGCNLIREWFPLYSDLIILNNCPYPNCQYPGCPKSCLGRDKVKTKVKQYQE